MKYTDIHEKYKKLRMAVADAVSCDEKLIAVITQKCFNNGFITAITQSETGVISILQADENIDICNAVYIDSTVIDAIKKAALGKATKRV